MFGYFCNGVAKLVLEGGGGVKKISWTCSAKNEEVLLRVEEEKNFLHTVKRRKDNWVLLLCYRAS